MIEVHGYIVPRPDDRISGGAYQERFHTVTAFITWLTTNMEADRPILIDEFRMTEWQADWKDQGNATST